MCEHLLLFEINESTQVGDKVTQFCLYFAVLEEAYFQEKDTLMLHKKFLYVCGGGLKIKSIEYSVQSS